MTGRESVAVGMFPQLCQSKGMGVRNQEPEYAAPRWAGPDPVLLLWFDADGDELGQRCPVLVEHAERAVAGPRHRTGFVDYVSQ